ncbi:MAG: helix-turn-helix domain-containing protein [Pseudomonadota bacterium]
MVKSPGQPARGSTSGRPIMVLLDILGKRWTLRVLWELYEGGAASFRELRARCEDVSPTVLNARLKELRQLEIVLLRDKGYALTPQGKALARKFMSLNEWADDWAASLGSSKT